MKIKAMLLTPNKYSRPQTPLKKITKIAVHYVGNANTTALANRNYFNNLANTHSTFASAHYIIGMDGEIIQCIPENEIAYCTNSANSYSISIENCHPKADGKFTEATRKSLMELCAHLCSKYNLDPEKDIIRHYDVSGKMCPLYWVNHPDDFQSFKREVKDYVQNGGNDMVNLKELDERLRALEDVQNEKVIYKNLEDIPEWGKDAINYLISKGALNGDGKGLNLTYEQLRVLVVNYRAFVQNN